MAHELPQLPYSYDALEPHIDARTMEIHYTKHHQGYVDKLNAALEGRADLQNKTIIELLSDLASLPEDVRTKVRNNGGGHYNHSLFWQLLSPSGGEPGGELASAINESFGDFAGFKEKFGETAANLFGSGWVWLALDENKKLHLHQLPLQDNPVMHGHAPILGLDVWEHAYYLKYANKRAEYIEAWWNVVNWTKAQEFYEQAK